MPAMRDALNQAGELSEQINSVTALAEMLGSPKARFGAKSISDSAKACGDLYQAQYLRLAGLRGGGPHSFDSSEAEHLCGELEDSINSFIDAIRHELKSD